MDEGGPWANIHKDVLGAEPEGDEAIASLCEELKARGNSAFKAKRLMEADVLYSKAIEINPKAHTFLGNRSAARLGMGKNAEALEDAESAIAVDPSWAKGFFRKGQACDALKRFDEAVSAYEEVMKLEPENKAVPKKLKKAKEAAKDLKENPPAKTESKTKVVTRVDWTEADEKRKREDVVKDKVKDKDKIRGYKITKDGKKTTFFNHEQTEEEKRLIGNIAPKAISADKAPVTVNDKGVGSAWNNGTTFEERNMTGWAKDALERHLMAVEVDLPSGEWGDGKHSVSIKKIKKMEGDASIPIVRGKVKFVFDFSFTLNWTATIGVGGEEEQHKGEITFPDVSSDHDNTFDSEVAFKTVRSTERACPASKLMKSHVKGDTEGLKPALVKAILAFEEEFRQQGPK